MCLIFFAYERHPRYRLVVAANRDEAYERPTATAAYWPEYPEILAGRDLEGGGTWMGINRSGRFAALTNVRSPRPHLCAPPTRGELTTDFLRSSSESEEYFREIEAKAQQYNGFSLLLYDAQNLHYFSNFTDASFQRIDPGLYGLSNHLLDTPWPKVLQGKKAVAEWLETDGEDPEPLFDIMARKSRAREEDLPDTGVDKSFESALSALFIESPGYGTRSTSVLLVGYDGACVFIERTFEADSPNVSTVRFDLDIGR